MKTLSIAALALAGLMSTTAFAQVSEDGGQQAPSVNVEINVPEGAETGVEVTTQEAPAPSASGAASIPERLADGRRVWFSDPHMTHVSSQSGDSIAIGGLLTKMIIDAATADEMCRGGIQGTDQRATGCAVRDYLNSTLAEVNICEDRYLDEAQNAFVRVYAECVAQ